MTKTKRLQPVVTRVNARLKAAILASGHEQRAVAMAANLYETQLSRIVNGHVEATPEEQRALAAVLDVPVSQLFPTGRRRPTTSAA
jgi:transcriptional regulator with XRE-family HTH domain